MRRVEQRRGTDVTTARSLVAAILVAAAGLSPVPASAQEPALRYRAPITLQQSAAFVLLPLPASAYAHSEQDGLADLRIVDARGERVPFAVLPPRASAPVGAAPQREAALYALPRRPAAGAPWASPLEVVVQGERISVKRRASTPSAAASPADTPGWLVDLGERRRDEPAWGTLKLAWAGSAEFSAPYELELSDDLQHWRPGGSGQLLSLNSAAGPLTQPSVPLPRDVPRFVRLLWQNAVSAPTLTSATLLAPPPPGPADAAPTPLVLTPSTEPPSRNASSRDPADAAPKGALHFDLGAPLPLAQLALEWTAGTHVAPVRVFGRSRVDEPWGALGQSVFYRLERGAAVSLSPSLPLDARARYLRVVPDERASALDASLVRLAVQAQLARLVFATQGQPPFELRAGSADARPGALPITTLVPALDDERARFGQARVGDWSEVAEVAEAARAEQRRAALRPWLLWMVLGAGVASLGWMVWRLRKG